MGFKVVTEIGAELTEEEVVTLIVENAPATPDATPSIQGKVFALTNTFNNGSGTALGQSALGSASGNQVTAVGFRSLMHNTTGNDNTAVGARSLIDNTTGYLNTAIGLESLGANISGYGNVSAGAYSLNYNDTGYKNVAIGNNALQYNGNGYNNTAVGDSSLYSNHNGYDNVAVGRNALGNNLYGNGNVALGTGAGLNESGSNKLYIANSNTSTPLIYGNFSTSELTVNGSLTVTSGITMTNGIGLQGTPLAPTASLGTNNTQIATTQYVRTELLYDKTQTLTINSNAASINLNTGAVAYLYDAASANWSINFTGMPALSGRMTISATLIVNQGTTGYIPNVLKIDGTEQSIRWQGGSAPTPTSGGKIDIFSFSMFYDSGTWSVFGSMLSNF